MQSKLYCKILAVGIICLFIAVGIQPAFAVDTKQSIVNKASEEDCGCSEVDDRQLVVLEKQLNRIEVYSKLFLVLSKHHPELTDISVEVSNRISTLKGLFEVLIDEPNPIICAILEAIYPKLWDILYFFASFRNSPSDLVRLISYLLSNYMGDFIMLYRFIAEVIFECDWVPPPPLKSNKSFLIKTLSYIEIEV